MQNQSVFEKILVPSDGSIPSVVSQELAAFLAKKFNSKVTVIHIVSHELLTPSVGEFYSEWDISVPVGEAQGETQIPRRAPGLPSQREQTMSSEITNWYHNRGSEILENAVRFFKEEGVQADQKIVQHADPGETIINEAEKGKYNLIVIGYSGEKEKKPHLGSVAEKVSYHASIPVLIAQGKNQISKILVPIDGSESAKKALQRAASIAKETGAKITLLYVQESGLFRLRPEVTKEVGTRILSNGAGQVKGLTVDQKLESGDPGKIINETADKGDYDLIVLGSKGHGALGRFFMGSVSNHVIHYASRSVLLVK